MRAGDQGRGDGPREDDDTVAVAVALVWLRPAAAHPVVATGFGTRAAQRRITMRAEAPSEDSLEPPSFLQS